MIESNTIGSYFLLINFICASSFFSFPKKSLKYLLSFIRISFLKRQFSFLEGNIRVMLLSGSVGNKSCKSYTFGNSNETNELIMINYFINFANVAKILSQFNQTQSNMYNIFHGLVNIGFFPHYLCRKFLYEIDWSYLE